MQRSSDVLSSSKSFASLLLPPHVQQALRDAGFRRPSPVQEAALPLARLGADLIVQAKAGTGKTLVFAAAAVERVDLTNAAPQVGTGRRRRRRRTHALHPAGPRQRRHRPSGGRTLQAACCSGTGARSGLQLGMQSWTHG